MDKKNAIFGVLFLAAAVAAFFWSNQQEAKNRQAEAERKAQEAAEQATWAEEGASPTGGEGVPALPLVRGESLEPTDGNPATALVREVRERLDESQPEQTATLENPYFRATFSSRGAALQTVALIERKGERLAYPTAPDSGEPVVLHALAKTPPLTIAQAVGERFAPLPVAFALTEQATDRVVFEATLENGLSLRRTYTVVAGGDDTPENYTLRQEFSITNPSAEPVLLDDLYVNVGTAAPTNADPRGMDLNASYYDDGSYENIQATKLRKTPRIEREGVLQWGSVKNQFFTSILTPDQPASHFIALPVSFPTPADAKQESRGVTAYLRFDLGAVPAGETRTLSFDYYTGPKDFTRLKQMSLKQEDVMHFGWFIFWFVGIISIVGKTLFSLLSLLHDWVGNWGFAIILMTLIVRLCLWPLTAKAARSSKRMQELQKPMAEIKEKYKDNPQKQQQATLELFKKHKINPLSSCWPVLLQFPIFIAMFNLLRNTSDLRFAEFLWIQDLSMPDATINLGETSLPLVGHTINILPFIWVVSMWFQMKMMPQPSVDNAQTKMIKYMPFIFFPFTYVFSSGLVLYWTTTNCFSIFQGWMTRRNKDAEDIAIEEEIAESERKKSVLKTTPLGGKKRKKKDGGQPGVR